jgi:hypothetical protein
MPGWAWYLLGVATPGLAFGVLYLGASIADFVIDHVGLGLSVDLRGRPDYRGGWVQVGEVARDHGFCVLVRIPLSHRGVLFTVGWGPHWSRQRVWEYAHARGWPGFERPWSEAS